MGPVDLSLDSYKMASRYSCLFGGFVLILTASQVSLLQCKAGYPTLGQLTPPNLPDTECSGPNFEAVCYVMYTDYHYHDLDAWTYGCIFKGSLNKCNQSFEGKGVTNNYCCCDSPGCNDVNFASSCGRKP